MIDDIKKPSDKSKSNLSKSNNIDTSNNKIHSFASKTKQIYQDNIKQPAIRSISTVKRQFSGVDITRSDKISRHSNDTNIKEGSSDGSGDIAPTSHPMVNRVESIRSSRKDNNQNSKKSMQTIKQEAINKAMESVDSSSDSMPPKTGFWQKNKQKIIAISLSILVIVGLALTYYFVPSLSNFIASHQANINTSYPKYRPQGFDISGPITAQDGEVVINFKSSSDSNFTIRQSSSSWNSTALESEVSEITNDEFITLESNGLTIFIYNHSAAWVNGGILYWLSGNVGLSSDQIQRLANSF